MEELFGIPMQTIMYVLLGIFAVSMLSVGYIFVANRVMFKMGLRNLPRRGLQTGLVVIGLMLATLIITASFTTGDTIDHSISARAYDHWQRTDLNINLRGDQSEDAVGPAVYVPEDAAGQLNQQFTNDADIELFVPFLYEKAAATNHATLLSEPNANIVGVDADALNQAGGLRLAEGGTFDLTQLGVTDVLVSERTAEELEIGAGEPIALFVAGSQFDATVAGVVKDEQASGTLGDFDDLNRAGGVAVPLATLQDWTDHQGQINYISVTLKGDVRSTVSSDADAAAERVERFINGAEGQAVLGLGGRTIEVEAVKKADVEEAEEFGNIFTTFFMIIGLFSIAAGIMLIFMIFVMLAAERKPEMGMARAVGAQRSNLVQSFVAEGMSYNLIAGAIGAALGIGAALALIVGYLRFSLGDDFDFIEAHVTVRSLIISYCLGVTLTFITVVIASMKVSGVNIVAAIRGTPEDETPEKRKIAWKAVLLSFPAMIIPPLGLWLLLRKGLGISWTWILAPAGILLSAFLIQAANSSGSEALFSLGFSILPLCLAAIATHHRVPGRIVWTSVGIFLAAYWLSPWSIGEELLNRELTGDIEMFPVSGVMVVIAFTLIIVWNASLLTLLFKGENGGRYRVPAGAAVAATVVAAIGVAMGDSSDGLGQLFFLVAGLLGIVALASFAAVRFPRLAPALKMGVAYPLSNRFRTGMTIAMFSLIIFSLTVFSAINSNFTAMLTGEDGDGGYQVVATVTSGDASASLIESLSEVESEAKFDIAHEARVSVANGQQEVRPEGVDAWTSYPVLAADESFFAEGTKLDSRATGYESDESVLAAVRTDPTLALIDTTVIDDVNEYEFTYDLKVEDGEFAPFRMSVRDVDSGKEQTVTVVGVWASRLIGEFISGVYVNADSYRGVFGEPSYPRSYVALVDGADDREAARNIEAALGTRGVQADAVREIIDDDAAQDRAFTRMFQAFMALGLFVGIAALGVIAFRSVVERRQQIGMLRAIGYQTESIALTFVLESSFIALMGILSGVMGGVIISRNLFTTGQFSGEGIEFSMPWSEVAVFTVAAFVVSLLMTWWPSRNAAKVPVADALRYE
jgi:putative ABC transport system permease protein